MTSNPSLEGKVAIVTGAGGTLCSELARGLAQMGVRVALLGRTLASLERVAGEIAAAGGSALPLSCDVTDEAALQRAHEVVLAEFGPVDFLLNGAGGNQKAAVTTVNEFTPDELADEPQDGLRGFFNLDMDAFQSVVTANTLGTVLPTRVFGRDMAAADGGAIINFASMNSYRPLTRNAAYAIAKAGISNLTLWLGAYLAPAGIRVNAIAPGFFPNDRSRAILGTVEDGLLPRGQQVIDHTPMRRFGKPRELLGTVVWLLDEEMSGFVTGVTIPVDGGFRAFPGV